MVLAFVTPASAAPVPALVSVAADGGSGNGDSTSPALSADGRTVAFTSGASDLVSGDTNGVDDIFVRDTTSGTTERVSVASDGTQGGGASFDPVISADGRTVAFTSIASNLVAGDTNARQDVFLHDRVTGTTERVSVSSSFAQATGGASSSPSMSADGRTIAFESGATNLVAGDTNLRHDIFIRDRELSTTTRVSLTTGGAQSNGFSNDAALSADATTIAFSSTANNLVDGDTNTAYDVFVRVLATGVTTRVSVADDGTQGNGASRFPAISANGSVVAFESLAATLVPLDGNGASDVFVRSSGSLAVASVAPDGSVGNGTSTSVGLSGDGGTLVFTSSAANLVEGDTNGVTDVFARDLPTAKTDLVSLGSGGIAAAGDSMGGAVGADAKTAAFASSAGNIVDGDANGRYDVFRVSLIKDADGDGVLDPDDNCVDVPNPGQTDTDSDTAGDACDPDDDGDGALDTADNCVPTPNADQTDTDGDTAGNACDPDDDGDAVLDVSDNCALTPNTDQTDTDGDAAGDACDPDDDGDEIVDLDDVCALLPGLLARQGCPVSVGVSFVLDVKDQTKTLCGGRPQCEVRPSGAVARLFDRNDAAFVAAYSSADLDAIFAGTAGRIGECVTTDGACTAGTASPADVVAVVQLGDSGYWVYTSFARDMIDFTDSDANGSPDYVGGEVLVSKHAKPSGTDFKSKGMLKVVPQ